MVEILSVNKTTLLRKSLKKQGKTIVLVGGCFDILHPGHVFFLEKAKKVGDILVVFLESDQKVRELKGINRPVHTQIDRAKVLAALRAVDYVVLLPYIKNETEYDELVGKIKPDVIATTIKDANTSHHQRSARLVGAKFKLVARVINDYSTSSLISSITVQ